MPSRLFNHLPEIFFSFLWLGFIAGRPEVRDRVLTFFGMQALTLLLALYIPSLLLRVLSQNAVAHFIGGYLALTAFLGPVLAICI